jgi:hypothetical protein
VRDGLDYCVVATEAVSRTPFFDSNSTTNVPTTVKPPAGDRSSTVKYFRVWTNVGRGTVYAHSSGFAQSSLS